MEDSPIISADDQDLENYRLVFDYINHPPQTAAELYEFLTALSGEIIPAHPICEGHGSPWAYIWRSYRIDLPEWKAKTRRNVICIGPRSGVKTLSQAKLIVAEMLMKKQCETIGMGAIEQQSNRCYEYASKYLKHPVIQQMGLIQSILSKKVVLKNKSSYEQVCATVSGVNSAHTQKVRLDEVDLVREHVIEEAKMIPSTKHGIAAHMNFISTRKYVDGPMDNLAETAEAREFDVITWCMKEVSEPCPESRRGTQEKTYEVENPMKTGERVLVKAYEGCGQCKLLPVCQGDLARSRGYVPINDTIAEFLSMDLETFLIQKLCKRPRQTNLFFAEFDKTLQVGDFSYNPNLPLDLTIDFTNGGESPSAFQVWQEDDDQNNFMIAERRYVMKPSNDIAADFIQFCADMGYQRFRFQIGDPANPQAMRDLNEYDPIFYNVFGPRKVHRKEGWPLCRRQIRNAAGKRKLFINGKYGIEFVREIINAKRSNRDPDDIKAGCSDHGLDAWRYREVFLRLMGGAEPGIRDMTDGPAIEPDSDDRPKSGNAMDEQIRNWFASDD